MREGRRPSIEERLKAAIAAKQAGKDKPKTQADRDRELGLSFRPNDSEGYKRARRANAERRLRDQQGQQAVEDQRAGGRLGNQAPAAPRRRGQRAGGRVYNRPPRQEAPKLPQRRDVRRPISRRGAEAPTPTRSRTEQRPSQADLDGQRRLIQGQIRGIDGKIYQAEQAMVRARRENDFERVYQKEALVEALKRHKRQLEQQLTEIPPEA